MKASILAGIMAVAFGVGMASSGQAQASGFGYCGPENQGQTREHILYHSNGMISAYFQFMCNNGQWEEVARWYCDSRGQCINLS
ncbi:MAG TPA: hypothetical protein VGE64_04060 [Xanthomonadaceae bacterium]|jgi:hypothetical protein